VFKGYIGITKHWIDLDWNLKAVTLDFKHFPTPHTGESAATILREVLDEFHISPKFISITTDNGSDIVAGVRILYRSLQTSSQNNLVQVHTRCVAYVINLAVRECFSLVHDEFWTIRKLISSIRCSTKRRDMFDSLKKEMGSCYATIPCLDVEARWSSTYQMLLNA